MTANESARNTTPRMIADAQFTPGRFFLLLAGILFARFPHVFLGSETFFYRDYGLFTYPVAHYYRECFWRGEFPQWNPLNNFGVPFLAQWNTALLYPPALFYLLLPLTWALAVFNLAHLVFAGMGMYFLARRWTGSQIAGSVAGMAFAINGLSLHMLMWVSNLAAWAWMPWVVLTVERAWREGGRRIAIAALTGGIQMLSGAPELILLTWLFLAALWIGEFWSGKIPRGRMLIRLVLVAALVAGLAAAQLLPFMELLSYSQRDPNFGGSKWSMPGFGWANFFVPLVGCTPAIIGIYSQDEQQWTSSYYMGIGIVALALLALWRSRDRCTYWLGAAAIGGVVLAMGDNAYLYGFIKRVFPLMGVMRYPIKIVVLTVFTLPLLAAFALRENSSINSGNKTAAQQIPIIGVFTGVLICLILFYSSHHPVPNESWAVTRDSGMSRLPFLVLILAAAWLVSETRIARMIGLAGAGMVLLIAVDVFTHAPNQNPTLPANIFGPLGTRETVRARYGESRALLDPKLQAFLLHASPPDMLNFYIGLRRALDMDCNLIDDIPTGSGFFSLELRDATRAAATLNYDTGIFPENLADFVGGSQVSSPDTSFTWTSRTNFMPLITAGQKPVFLDDDSIFRSISSREFNPRTMVYLPLTVRESIRVTDASAARITQSKFSAQRASFDVSAESPAMVVVAQAYYKPWHAYLDGARVQLFEANGAFQALEVPAGPHHVELVYEDGAFKYGVIISLASLLVVICVQVAKPRFI